MKLPLYSRIRLRTAKYEGEGAKWGDLGYIIEVYEDAYEIEISDSSGITLALLAAKEFEVESAPEFHLLSEPINIFPQTSESQLIRPLTVPPSVAMGIPASTVP